MRAVFFLFAFLQFGSLAAARYSDGQPTSGSLRHEVNNHDAEIRMLREQLNTQEALIESLRSDIKKSSQESQESNKNTALKTRVADLDTKLLAISQALDADQKRIGTLEGTLEQLSKNSKQLEKSLSTLLDAIATSSSASTTGSEAVYKVADGDSLEKIARRHKTTIKALKELNGLDSDRIIVGQKLKLPQ